MDKSKVLVLGNGFLGKQFGKNGFSVVGRDGFDFQSSMNYADLESFKNIKECDVIINTIGKADTRWCEKPENWNELFKVNSELPYMLSKFCKKYGKKLVHISSGCVYDRNDIPQKETDFVSSHCRYVVSKLNGEYGCDPEVDLILRPRLYYGDTPDKNNLLSKMPKFDNFLSEVNSFTSVQTIVEATEALLHNNCSGIFNVADKGYKSVFDVAGDLRVKGGGIYKGMSAKLLRSSEDLYLVNNIMDTSKLEKYYVPRNLEDETKRCWKKLNSN